MQASADTGVPVDVLQFIHRNEVNISLEGPNQGTLANPQGYGGYFGLPSSLFGGGDPLSQALTTAKLLIGYGAKSWQDAIRIFNVGQGGSLSSSYAVNFSSGDSPPSSSPSSSTSGSSSSASTSPAQSSSSSTANGNSDFTFTMPITNQTLTIPGTGALTNIVDWAQNSANWWKLGLTAAAVLLLAGGTLIYVKGELVHVARPS